MWRWIKGNLKLVLIIGAIAVLVLVLIWPSGSRESVLPPEGSRVQDLKLPAEVELLVLKKTEELRQKNAELELKLKEEQIRRDEREKVAQEYKQAIETAQAMIVRSAAQKEEKPSETNVHTKPGDPCKALPPGEHQDMCLKLQALRQ